MSDQLLTIYDETRFSGAHVVVLDGEIGRGKTHAIQQFYDTLALRAPSEPWVGGLSPTRPATSTQDLLRSRKAVRGIRVDRVSRHTPWFWIGAVCDSLNTEFDAAASDLAQQLDQFVADLGYDALPAAARVLADGAVDFVSDALQVSTVKTIVDTVRGLARVASAEYESRPIARGQALRAARARLLHNALVRLKVDSNRPGAGVPLVAVLDDAHLSGLDALHLLGSLLMPAASAARPGTFFPEGVAVRQNPILVIVCRWPHTATAPGWASSALNQWLGAAGSAGVPITTITMPNGMPRAEALLATIPVMPSLSQDDRERLVGSPGAAHINPLVLNMRITEAASHMDDPARATDFRGLDISRLPVSPLDHVRQYYDALPPPEKRIVARLASYGPVAPWRLLIDESDNRSPEQAIPDALRVGLLSRAGPSHDLVSAVGFSDDLSVAFFEQQMGMLLSGTEMNLAVILRRIRPWVERIATDPTVTIASLTFVGGQLAAASKLHRGHPDLPTFASFAMADPRYARAVCRGFAMQSVEWSERTLAGELLAIASKPRRLGKAEWVRLFSKRNVRSLLENRPDWLASRAGALSKHTMACRELRDTLQSSLEIDGEVALWRLEQVAGVFQNFDFDAVMNRLRQARPELTDAIDLVVARHAGPTTVIEILAHRNHLSTIQADALAEAYVSVRDIEKAAVVLASIPDDEEFAIRSARLFQQAGLVVPALEVLAPFADSANAALTAADIEPEVEAALAHAAPFLESNLHARAKTSQLLARAGRNEDALRILRSTENPTDEMLNAIRSLEARKHGTPRDALLRDAEEGWRLGDFARSTDVLRDHVQDPAIAAVWAEYAWVTRSQREVMDTLRPLLPDAPTLSVQFGELANELPALAVEHGWLRDADPTDVDLWLSKVRLDHGLYGNESVPRSETVMAGSLTQKINAILRAASQAGEGWQSDLKLALTLEHMGHVGWSFQIIHPWLSTDYGEAIGVRQMVDYGRLDEAAIWLGTTTIQSLSMASTRASWHLARNEWKEAGQAFTRLQSRTPQAIRLTEIIPAAEGDPRAALEAANLLTQMRLYSASFAVLAASHKVHENADVERMLRRARYKTPAPQRLALHRHRRRWAIRGLRDSFIPGDPDH